MIAPNTLKLMFSLNIELTKDKTRSIVNNVGRALVRKKVLKLDPKDIDIIYNSDVYNTYKDHYLSKEEELQKLLEGILSANGLQAQVGVNKADGTAVTFMAEENAINKALSNRFSVTFEFNFFSYLLYPYGLREDLFLWLELNTPETLLLCTGETVATYKLQDISLKCCDIFYANFPSILSNMFLCKITISLSMVST